MDCPAGHRPLPWLPPAKERPPRWSSRLPSACLQRRARNRSAALVCSRCIATPPWSRRAAACWPAAKSRVSTQHATDRRYSRISDAPPLRTMISTGGGRTSLCCSEWVISVKIKSRPVRLEPSCSPVRQKNGRFNRFLAVRLHRRSFK